MANTKKKWLIWGLGLLIVALIALAVVKAKNKPKGTEVDLAKAEIKSIKETVSASGKIYPATEVKISSDVSGEIVELYVQEGDSVVVGQILAKIDPDTYLSAVERGKAAVNSSKSQLAMSRAQVENSRAQMEQITAQLENARTIHKRNDQLKKDGVISQVEFDQSLSNLRALEANLRAAEASIKSAQQSAEGQGFSIKSSEANLKELQTSLSRTTIKAPVSGIVSSLSVEKGERVVGTIQMTGTEMMRISNLNSMEVQVNVNENDIPKVSLGDEVEIKVDAYVGDKFLGTVTEIANSAANLISSGGVTSTDQVTNFTVKITVDPNSYADLIKKGNKYPLRPGMTASVDIFTNAAEKVITVPIQAVTVREKSGVDTKDKAKLTDDDYEEVVFIMQGDSAVKVAVVTGIQNDEFIEIKSGLKDSSQVISGPYNFLSKDLKQGDIVRKREEKDEKKK
ncbi:MAG: efflux RND transporter periplasmic adaptor subunit [Saprospiraceae bacterium]|nr:efflux RND transporter periplasmic adaptor subunit [Saprospiraceae bacterium]MBK8632521.1 efflux RND transporter periplasmic adaptor subunit [Saprospiraceae bacterium]HMS67719.1 efflux RND transporter periplasmic adaptor subunit [Saprospiraceae bacterium]